MGTHTGLTSHWDEDSSMGTHTGLTSHWAEDSSMGAHTGPTLNGLRIALWGHTLNNISLD